MTSASQGVPAGGAQLLAALFPTDEPVHGVQDTPACSGLKCDESDSRCPSQD